MFWVRVCSIFFLLFFVKCFNETGLIPSNVIIILSFAKKKSTQTKKTHVKKNIDKIALQDLNVLQFYEKVIKEIMQK